MAGTAGGLILGFAVILLLGRSRGWFVSEAYVRNIVAGHLPLIQYAPHQELELSSAPVYQMPGRPHEK